MKITIFFIALVLITGSISCNNSTTENSGGNTANVPEGMALMTKSDCMTCHNASTKIVGPSFANIATKYAANAENEAKLTAAVLNGGSGVWGAVSMPAHPGLSKADAGKMVSYILSLSKKQ